MKKFAQILNDKVHWIFEIEEKPDFAPNIILVDITDLDTQPKEGWLYKDEKFEPFVAPQEDVLKRVRQSRNTLLKSSDWTQLSDIHLSEEKIQAWKEYRQKLRDFPSTIEPGTQFEDIVFPQQP